MSKVFGITNQGVNLIRRAREEEGKVTISRVLLSSQYEDTSVAELFGRSLYFYDLGEATILGVNASNALIVNISLPDSPAGALVKSFAVFATYGEKEVMLYCESDSNAALILGGAPYTFTASLSINAADVIDNYGEVADVSALAQQIDGLEQQVTALEQQIAGEYISQVSYDADSNVMTFKSQDGSRQIDISLE